MTKHEKYKQKLAKQQERELAWFMWKLRITKDMTQEEINERVLTYAKKVKDTYLIKLSDQQIHDKEFMMNLYNANSKTIGSHEPIDDLHNDYDYIIEYIKLAYEKIKDNKYFNGLQFAFPSSLKYLLEEPDFIELLAEKMPDQNIMKVLSSLRYMSFSFTEVGSEYLDKQFLQLTEELSEEMLITQAKRFGRKFLENLPQNHSKYTKLVCEAVENDGFESLKFLKIDDVLSNKDYILRACVIDGIEPLSSYIYSDLSPKRTRLYYCHGELHGDEYFDKKYEVVQKELLKDPEIVSILDGSDNKNEQFMGN